MIWRRLLRALALTAFIAMLAPAIVLTDAAVTSPPAPRQQTAAEAQAKSAGCLGCHTATDSATMHSSPGVILGCTDCHGGNARAAIPAGAEPGSPDYRQALDTAHVRPRFPEAWNYPSSVKPPRTYTLLNAESREFIRFMNPS